MWTAIFIGSPVVDISPFIQRSENANTVLGFILKFSWFGTFPRRKKIEKHTRKDFTGITGMGLKIFRRELAVRRDFRRFKVLRKVQGKHHRRCEN